MYILSAAGSWTETHALLTTLRGLLTVHPLTLEIHEIGLELAERYGFSMYDAMIAASALHAGCDTLWSEDMRHDMVVDEGLRIVNPFRGDVVGAFRLLPASSISPTLISCDGIARTASRHETLP